MSSTDLKGLISEDILDLNVLESSLPKFFKHPSYVKALSKRLIKCWAEDDDSRSVLSLAILGKVLESQKDYAGYCGKTMFANFVRSSRHVNALSAGRINFMLNSVVQVYYQDLDEGYRHAFVYIRQLAITLRKAYTSGTKQDIQAVYNWQFVNSLKLWTQFSASFSDRHELIKSLQHPLVNVIVGMIRLSPSERWLPLRYHGVAMLHQLSGLKKAAAEDECFLPDSTVFVPTLPLLMDVIRLVDFNKRPAKSSKFPFDLRLMLHYSPSNRAENACLEATVAWLQDYIIDALALNAISPAFPELVYPVLVELKSLAKLCKVAKFSQMFKKIASAAQEHCEFISKLRQTMFKSITNDREMQNFKDHMGANSSSSPFGKFFAKHSVERMQELAQLAETKKKQGSVSQNDAADDEWDDDVEQAKKHKKPSDLEKEQKQKNKRKKEESDDDEQDESSDDSDASYDYDDGKQVVHVTRKEIKKNKNKRDGEVGEESDSDSDFDLEAALREVEPIDDDAVSIATSLGPEDDQLSDFDLSDFDNDKDNEQKEKQLQSKKKPKKNNKTKKVDEVKADDKKTSKKKNNINKKAKKTK